MRGVEKSDLEHILNNTKSLWIESIAKDSTYLITGATGFIGKWLLESFIYINERLSLNNNLIILSRDPEIFIRNYPHLNNKSINFIKGDIRDFKIKDQKVDYIIHGATDADANTISQFPLEIFDVIVNGTKNVLALAKQNNVKSFLFISSGAIYGEQPLDLSHITEDFTGSPNMFSDNIAYSEGKRVAEMLCNIYFKKHNVESKIARCFAFVGPYLPLDRHFAIGNFINDRLENKKIKIKSDGSAIRSYLYASDLSIWLWTILFRGLPVKPYNVGSDEIISIKELAQKIAVLNKDNQVVECLPTVSNHPTNIYVPSIQRASTELNLTVKINLTHAIQKTIDYYESK